MKEKKVYDIIELISKYQSSKSTYLYEMNKYLLELRYYLLNFDFVNKDAKNFFDNHLNEIIVENTNISRFDQKLNSIGIQNDIQLIKDGAISAVRIFRMACRYYNEPIFKFYLATNK